MKIANYSHEELENAAKAAWIASSRLPGETLDSRSWASMSADHREEWRHIARSVLSEVLDARTHGKMPTFFVCMAMVDAVIGGFYLSRNEMPLVYLFSFGVIYFLVQGTLYAVKGYYR